MQKGNRQHKHRRKQTNKKWDVRMRGRGMIVCFLCWREKRKKETRKKKIVYTTYLCLKLLKCKISYLNKFNTKDVFTSLLL